LIGSLSLAGFFPLAGFWSKDEILSDAWAHERYLFWIALAAVLGYSLASPKARLVERVNIELGGPHVLVALAGGSLGTPRDLVEIGPADLDLVLDVNVKGTFYCCQAVAPFLAAAGGGAIVTCSSIGARQPSPVTGAPYAAAKAAIGGLTRRLARELGPAGIRVNAVAPGLFLTDRLAARFEAMPEAERREVLDAIPLGRMPELREIVDPILFLASDAASFITGITLDVNGGRYLPA